MAVGTLHQESNVGGYGFKTTAHTLFINLASRKPVTTNTPRDPVEEYVNSVIVDSLPSAITLQELLLTSECDPTLKTIKEALDTGNWSAAPKPFANRKDELCQKRGIILRNNRIIIPDALRPRILQLAHKGTKASPKLNSISDKESGELA